MAKELQDRADRLFCRDEVELDRIEEDKNDRPQMILTQVQRQLRRLTIQQRQYKGIVVTEYEFKPRSTMDKNIRRISQQDIQPNKQAVLVIIEHYRSDYEEAVSVVCLAQDLKEQKRLEKQELLHIEKLESERRIDSCCP